MKLVKDNDKIEQTAKAFLSKSMNGSSPGDINQAMMDLGREICKPKNPNCIICPIKIFCMAHIKNQIEQHNKITNPKQKMTQKPS